MSSMIEDRRPFAAAMQNYHLMDVDASVSQSSLNIPEDNGKKYRAERPGIFGVNTRLLLLIISIIFFILTLILFIGTIVAYYNRPATPLNGSLDKLTGSGDTPPRKEATGESDVNPANPQAVPPPDGGGGFETDKWSVTTVNGKHVRPGELVFREEFNSFDTDKWFHYTGVSSDSQFCFNVNNRSNSFVKDGILFLKPTYTHQTFGEAYVQNGTLLLGIMPSAKCINDSIVCWHGSSPIVHPIMTPMIMSKNFFSYRYGKLQIKAKMPAGDWIEPIMSLQPEKFFYGSGLTSGQIQFVDTRGNRKLFNLDGLNIGSEQNCPDIRFGTSESKKVIYDCLNTEEDEGFDKDFHIYELEWTPENLIIRIDNEGVVSAPFPRPSMYQLWSKGQRITNPWFPSENSVMAPFDKSFHLAIGINVGGTNGFFSDDAINKPYPKPWNNTDVNAPKTFWDARDYWEPTWDNYGSAMQIDFIRLYALNETVSD